jgi:hypothetical protein
LKAVALERSVPLLERRPALDEDLAAIVERAMSPSPAERFSSMRAFARALLPFASDRARALWEGAFDEVELAELLARRDSGVTLPFVDEPTAPRPARERPAAWSDRAVRAATGSHTWPAVEPATVAPVRRRGPKGAALVVVAVALAVAAVAIGARGHASSVEPAAAAVVALPRPAAPPAPAARPGKRIFVAAPLAITVARVRHALGTPPPVADPAPRSRDALVGDEIFAPPKTY